ncbi:MAG: CDP-diacylglycerol--glycerol-3-phosphate 3-phosphatidyltransferase [Magnetospirillum sp.]|nr:CDP-diacylglycerol--glycerol-3-phosphate 3-phosphatidyltransferase [Magnetospirillum sp.]
MMTSLPNLLTLSRIVVIPLVVATFYVDGALARWIACGLFVAAAVTDWFDGYLARSRNQVSALGRFLDPIADKLLVSAVLLMLVAFDRVSPASVLPALVILLREILVSGLREFLAEIRISMPVSRLAKWKTGFQMVALAVLLVGDMGPRELPVRLAGEACLWVAAILTMITGWDYLQSGLKHMRAPEPKAGAEPHRAGP